MSAFEKVNLRAGRNHFAPLERIRRQDQDDIDLWSARDALVMKALTIVLSNHLPVLPRCTHVKGHSSSQYALRQDLEYLLENRFILRIDVKSNNASIDHLKALDQLADTIKDKAVLNLLCQTMRRSTTRGDLYRDYWQGISRGCPLSRLIGAFFLNFLDPRIQRLGLFCVRFIDDILVLAPTRWKLCRAVRLVNE